MSTTVEHISKQITKERCQENGMYASYLFKMQDCIREAFPSDLTDCFHQQWAGRGKDIELHNVASAMELYSQLYNGQIAFFSMDVKCEPFADANIQSNKEAVKSLANTDGDFWGGKQGADGFVRLTKPVHAQLYSPEGVQSVLVPVKRFPLEVGTNSASKFLIALAEFGCLARWPYGQKQVTFFTEYFVCEGHTDFNELKNNAVNAMHACGTWQRWDKQFRDSQEVE